MGSSYNPGAVGALLYTSQALTQAQAGQARINLSPTGGAKGYDLYAGDNTGAWGPRWVKGDLTTTLGQIWAEDVNDKIHFDFLKRLSITPQDGTVVGTVIQIGAANGTAGDDVINIPPQGTASAGATLKNSQNLQLNGETWTSGARASGGVRLRGVPLTTAQAYAFQVAKNDMSGYTAASACIQTENGTNDAVSYGFIGAAGMGMWNTGGTVLRLQRAGAGSDDFLEVLSGGTRVGPSRYFRTGYDESSSFGSAASLGIRLYYTELGFGTNGSGEGYASANNSGTTQKVFSWLGASGLRVESGKTFTLGNAAAAAVAVASTHKLRILDSTGTAYDVLAIAA